FSIWSANVELTGGPTRHWTGKPQPLTSLVRIDGHAFRIMGDAPKDIPPAHQVGLTVFPTRTQYEFEEGGVHLTLTFMTPLLPDDLSICSRPVTYVTWSARATEGNSHQVSVYFDGSANVAVNTPDEPVAYARGTVGDLTTLRVGTVAQPVLEARGDDLRINWGYFYVAANAKHAGFQDAERGRAQFAKDGSLPAGSNTVPEVAAQAGPTLAVALPLGNVSAKPVSAHVILAYDDLYSIRYFNDDLKAYWRKDGASITDLLRSAESDYDALTQRCEAFDRELVNDMKSIGGDSYAQLGVLAWRQALAAQKLCVDANGQPLMFSKENFSNGCISTVDVLYPAAPQMIAFCPTMLKASLVPLLDYSSSARWKHDSAPHDLGTYPHATGQVYGGGEQAIAMPVEESGNMLVLLGALAKAEGNADFSSKYWPTLTRWADYLKAKGLDPENQLTTDDFAGHIARNANLSAKAIMGIASYGMLADMLGKKDEAAASMKIAREYAQKWMALADDGDHYKLVFGDRGDGTWSQKYNLVWDRLLGFNVFPPEVAQKEWAYYRTKMNVYGLPLDSRKSYTKLDWELWTATLANNKQDFQMIVDACAKWANETPDRVPMSDWYDTISGHKSGFQARSVVGGLFIPFLSDPELWHKYAGRDKTNAKGWAAGDFAPPVIHTIVAAADTEPATWRYTTRKPVGHWMNPGYDDSSWASGKSGFGTPETPGARVNTRWDSNDIYLRREITLPDAQLMQPRLYLHHDEDAEIYINGVLAAHPRGFTAEYVTLPISPAARHAMHPGKNVIAVHCHQTIAGQYIDVGIVEVESKAKH
ncbi:MAG: glutaminase domain-containing protein, partial [Tepidisphaeraceae bacterium]